jgi:crotonobetainyl-CoA:carnitine CoA-transferase CaiB-like acyl-CoA transferase
MVLAPYGLFHAADGPLAVAPSTAETWVKLCQALGLTELVTDPRFDTNVKRMARRAEINALVEAKLRTRPRAEWIEKLNQAGVPCGPIQDLAEALADPQTLHQEMVLVSPQPSGPVKMMGFPVKLSATPCLVHRPSPQLGEHTVEVLRELGYTGPEIEKLKADKVVIAA